MSKTEKKHQRKDLDLSIQHQACDPQKRNMSLMGRHREGPSIHYMAGKMREVKKCKRRREQREYKKKKKGPERQAVSLSQIGSQEIHVSESEHRNCVQ